MTTSIANKKKVNKADFMFKGRENEILVKNPGDINGIDFMLHTLTNCSVYLMDYTA
jgi:protein XRP2